jgi:hypothetical protein
MAESTRTRRRGIYRREVEPAISNRRLPEVSSDDVRTPCLKIKNSAVRARVLVALGRRADNRTRRGFTRARGVAEPVL